MKMAKEKTIRVNSGSLHSFQLRLILVEIFNQRQCSPSCRQVKGDAVLWSVPVFNVAEESNETVKSCHDYHSNVQNTASSPKRLRLFHVVLQRNDDTDSFECEQNGSEVKWKAFDGGYRRSFSNRWQILENVIENKAQADESHDIS